jgi:hypothetical protein
MRPAGGRFRFRPPARRDPSAAAYSLRNGRISAIACSGCSSMIQ